MYIQKRGYIWGKLGRNKKKGQSRGLIKVPGGTTPPKKKGLNHSSSGKKIQLETIRGPERPWVESAQKSRTVIKSKKKKKKKKTPNPRN